MESTPGSAAAPATDGPEIDVEIAETAAEAPAAAPPASPDSEVHAAGSGDELDFDQAEHFAASFRPSWAPDEPVAPSIPAPVHVSGPARVVRVGTRSDLSAPKLRKQRGAAYAILSASLLGVVGLLYLAIASSSTKPNPQELARSTAASKREPVETSVQAAQKPPVAPAVTPPAAAPEPVAAEPEQPAEPEQLAAAEPAPTEPAAVAPPASEPAPAAEPPPAAPPAAEPEVAAAPPPPAAKAPEPAPAPAPAPPVVAAAPVAAKPAPAVIAAAPVAAKPPQPSAAAPERPNKVMLSLGAFPPNTQLRIDGGIVENPFRMRLPRSSKHRIEARAPGYAPETHVLRMDADVQLMISLKRDPSRDVKPDPYRDARHSAANAPGPTRPRGAGFVSENPY